MPHILTLKQSTYQALRDHLYPGDGLEAAAIMLCHTGTGKSGLRLLVNELILIAAEDCPDRTSHSLSWPFADYLSPDKITEIDNGGLSIMTIHSHPNGYDKFSAIDDRNDKALFGSVNNWFDDGRPSGSAIMLPGGEIIARLVSREGKFTPVQTASVIGENITIWKRSRRGEKAPDYASRIAQTFGKGTYQLLREMRVGVVGCSGTGSIVVELLARNCVGHLVIADPDCVAAKNLNRIVNATQTDANNATPKVEVLRRAIGCMGMNVQVDVWQSDTRDNQVIAALADCDVIFGCVDTAEGRYHLECIASAYLLPYFDVGVNLETTEEGKILQADTVSHYMHPESPSLLARGGYTSEQLAAEGWYRTDRKHYERQRMAGYLAAVGEDQPAVMSLNMQAACLAFNDFLARLHQFRLDSNDDFSTQRFRLVHGSYEYQDNKSVPDALFSKYSGMGEKSHLLQKIRAQ